MMLSCLDDGDFGQFGDGSWVVLMGTRWTIEFCYWRWVFAIKGSILRIF